jgi:hypothetical protein
MRLLNWEEMRKEQRGWAAFNLALIKAIDPRLVLHRPRDPEKKKLMSELGIEMSMRDVEEKSELRRQTRACKIDIQIELEGKD